MNNRRKNRDWRLSRTGGFVFAHGKPDYQDDQQNNQNG
jgi:hypothetical protein